MLKQKLQHKLLQKLSPQQIQLIKLLEVPTIELEQRIKKEIEENPILEEGTSDENEFAYDESPENNEKEKDEPEEEFSMEDYIEDDETPAYRLTVNNYYKDDKKIDFAHSEGASLNEVLIKQLGLRNISGKQKKLALYLLGNIDEGGYLRRDLLSIVDDLAFSVNLETNEDELAEILKIIQDFEPNGIGARNLQECLLIQIKKKQDEETGNKET